jgi:hypothetical protein
VFHFQSHKVLLPGGFLCRGRGDGKGVAEVPGSSLAGEVGRRPLALYQRGRRRKPAMRSFKSVFVSQACETKDNVVQEIDIRKNSGASFTYKKKKICHQRNIRDRDLVPISLKSFSRQGLHVSLSTSPAAQAKVFCAVIVPYILFHLLGQLSLCGAHPAESEVYSGRNRHPWRNLENNALSSLR